MPVGPLSHRIFGGWVSLSRVKGRVQVRGRLEGCRVRVSIGLAIAQVYHLDVVGVVMYLRVYCR